VNVLQPHLTFSLVALVSLLATANTSFAQDASDDEQYDTRWRAATNAVVTFATAELALSDSSGRLSNRVQLATTYRRERDNLARNVAWLAQTKPPSRAMLQHWKLLPVFEQILSAMTIVTNATEHNDLPGERAGWRSIADALARLRATVEEIAHASE
jgi:hypothetical protein